ncbi:MAG: inorganic diphosphatase [Acidimicrobiia bacterium]|nr:inorganic diphosphatase [Acidimicrobiia bacterium]
MEVIVEIPQGSRNKYEIDHETGVVWLDRHLFTAMRYPADYGFVPNTLAEDGDPLDALIILDEPTFPGVHVKARPIGVFWMRDEAGPDAKILCVPADDERSAQIQDLNDIRPHLLAEIGHFFEVYKALEPHKHTSVRDWEGVDAAKREIQVSLERYAEHHPE